MYRVSVKQSAVQSNDAVADIVEEQGAVLEFQSRTEAETLARRLSHSGDHVGIQKVAPQDPEDVDGYLISSPKRYTSEPKESTVTGLTFDVGPNQYGELGEALVCGSYGLSPGIQYYLYNELEGIEEETHRLRGTDDAQLPDDIRADVSWSPDCVVRVRSRADWRIVEQYFCEIKTGDASFERNQVRGMKAVARGYGVLKIRVVIDALPDEYTVRITEVHSE
ncbi:hypothetical protein [Natranaeroarchaeum aerophilus]|uniref:Uncharacterized protein n=1 Tax=Natranaeroarchaeum aerophilus TaxID=2917711 RepID=A0AAE3K5V9_9EURY|nr:hypothetical protein [Natranaeroarchaeum aerophilus]MCL9813760.1 hypothetical protein [Natranaeroarchaeum aerophilus]